MQKIIPHLWFDTQAAQAANFYTSVFDDAKIISSTILKDTPSGDAESIVLQLLGEKFMFISAGPYFQLNPSISFMVACPSAQEVEYLWEKFSPQSEVLMPLGSYPFSEKFGWLNDKFGVSWQFIYLQPEQITQRITPTLMFVGEQCGNAEKAMQLYTSIFNNSKIGGIMRYGANPGPDAENSIQHAEYFIENYKFATMDSALEHKFQFNEAVSFVVECETQQEIDYYWEKLSAYPEAEQCGWIKDPFGVSWQITPKRMREMLESKDQEKTQRVTQAFLQMKKFDIAELERVYNG